MEGSFPPFDFGEIAPIVQEAVIAEPPRKPSIIASHLSKTFEKKAAVVDVSLHVREGEFYGFLGPNGAGKSTTIKMLCGLMRADAGSIEIGGISLNANPLGVKQIIGVLPEETNLYERLTGEEYLLFAGQMYGLTKEETVDRTRSLIELMELTDERKKLIVDYSMGMRKKVALAGALIHRPRVLFLDEPFNGIDPISVRSIRNVMQQLIDHGTTILITSHVMEVIEKLCSRVAIINHGLIVAEGTLDELRAQAQASDASSLEDVFINLVGGTKQTETLTWL